MNEKKIIVNIKCENKKITGQMTLEALFEENYIDLKTIYITTEGKDIKGISLFIIELIIIYYFIYKNRK